MKFKKTSKIFKIIFVLFFTIAFSLSGFGGNVNAQSSNTSARFGGGNEQRITINLSNSAINIGAGNFTIEFWVKIAGVSAGAACSGGNDVFTNGGLIIDRDIWGPGNFGDFGISVMSDRRLAFSINNGSTGVTACSAQLALNTWYYIAAVKSGNSISIHVNGTLSQTKNWSGNSNLSYNFSHTFDPACPNPCQDPTFVIGAEKHRVGYNFNGFLDELRISNIARSISPVNSPFSVDGNTVALYRFEGNSASATGNFNGVASGISYPADVPFTVQQTPTPTQPPATQTPTPTQPPATQAPTQAPPQSTAQPTSTQTPAQQMGSTTTPTTQPTNDANEESNNDEQNDSAVVENSNESGNTPTPTLNSEQNNSDKASDQKEDYNPIWMFIIIGLGILGIVIGSILIFLFWKKRKREKKLQEQFQGQNPTVNQNSTTIN
jgi:hypothetical protein